MTGDKSKFLSLTALHNGSVTFGDNKKGKIIGIGKIGKSPTHSIDNVYLVKGLKHNLLSISQFCDKGNNVTFTTTKCTVRNANTNDIILEGSRYGNTYKVDLNMLPCASLTCLSVLDNDPLIWHRRLGHASLTLLKKLNHKELVTGLPKIKFECDKICEDCAHGKTC